MSVETKVVELLFKDKVIVDILVDELLPEVYWTPEANVDELPPSAIYNIARDNLRSKLKEVLD